MFTGGTCHALCRLQAQGLRLSTGGPTLPATFHCHISKVLADWLAKAVAAKPEDGGPLCFLDRRSDRLLALSSRRPCAVATVCLLIRAVEMVTWLRVGLWGARPSLRTRVLEGRSQTSHRCSARRQDVLVAVSANARWAAWAPPLGRGSGNTRLHAGRTSHSLAELSTPSQGGAPVPAP